MKKRIVTLVIALMLVVLTLWGAGGCLLDNITGSGNLQTASFDFSDFTAVSAHSGFKLVITRSDTFSIQIIADDNLLEYLEVEKSGETLSIRLQGTRLYYSATISAEITMPALYQLELAGGSQARISGFSSAHEFKAAISGGSKLNGIFTVGNVELELSGGSQVNLAGNANDLLIDASGGSLLEMENLIAGDASINLSGGSRATVCLSGTLDTSLSGGSKVLYVGEPAMGDIELSGGATVEKK